MSAPTITLINTEAMELIFEDKFYYKLYADDVMFNTWKDWVSDSANLSSVQYNQEENAAKYSGYVMKWYCNTNTSTPTGSGCCIREPNMGATCLVNTTASTAATYALTKDQDTAWAANSALPSAALLSDNSNNDPFFEIFDCTNSLTNYFTCYKFQLDEQKVENGFPRFDPDSPSSTGVFIDAHGGISASSFQSVAISSFKGALTLVASATAAVSMMSF